MTTGQAIATQSDSTAPTIPTASGCNARVYGVDYAVFDDEAGGTLYLTRYGLPFRNHLMPEKWFTNDRYITHGRRMATGTGTVYRMPLSDDPRRPTDVVVKFSRFAQDVQLDVCSTFDGVIDPEIIQQAEFLDPFQEFGTLMDLRRGRFGPRNLYVRTKRPLAIYRAPQAEPLWQLGRNSCSVYRARRGMTVDQASATDPVALDADRTYVVLFHWVRGVNLHEAVRAGLLSLDEIEPITRRVASDLMAKGFMVLDHKPQHVIVRPIEGGLLRRHGEVVYAIIDFELLERTRPYREWLLANRKAPTALGN